MEVLPVLVLVFLLLGVVCSHREIINPHEFNYLYNPGYSICDENLPSTTTKKTSKTNSSSIDLVENDQNIDILIYVHTSVSNFKNRVVIRETFARRSMFPNIRLVFMTGYVNDSKLNSRLKLEANIYKDIVQEDFIDTYRNITHKCVMALKWISTFCSQAKYILKVDDDVFVNTFHVLNQLFKQKNSIVPKDSMFCNGVNAIRVSRNKKSKWYVTWEEFPNYRFDPYCTGFFVIISSELIPAMYEESQYVRFFWIDDYWMSAMLGKAVNVQLIFRNNHIIIKPEKIRENYKKRIDGLYGAHMDHDLNFLIEMWNHLLVSYGYAKKNPVNLFDRLIL